MKGVKLIGYPFNVGQRMAGVAHAPAFMRAMGLIERLQKITFVDDGGDLSFRGLNCSLANFLISKKVELLDLREQFLLNIGGDHGMGLGTVHGMLSHAPETVVVWADAHGDINTPASSQTGNFHGMPLSYLLGVEDDPLNFAWIKQRLEPQKLILFGPRALDQAEEAIIESLQIQYYSSSDINRWGSQSILEKALKKADPSAVCPIHLNFDVDLMDPSDIYSTGTRELNGPTIRNVFSLGSTLARTGRLRSMDVVEINPEIGSSRDVKDTCDLIIQLLEHVLTQHAAFSHDRKEPSLVG